jgi:outer membrane protein assembly factor BamB
MRTAWMMAALAGLVSGAGAGDWPGFRGPGHQGISGESGFPLHWGPQKNIRWSLDLPDPGNASPVVVRGRVLLTSSSNGGRERSLVCYSRTDGKQLWIRTVEFGQREPTHETNPHGAVTPVTDGERIVVWHGSAGMFCYDLEGNLLWSRDLGTFRHIWGYASSPVIHEGKVIQLCGPGERQFLTALDLQTGATLWEHHEPGGSESAQGKYIGSWATPVVAQVDGRDQILCGLPTRVIACDPSTGEVLWYVTGIESDRGNLMYTTPLIGEQYGVALGGFGGPAMGFKLGGRGDVTATHRLWRETGRPRNPQRIGSGVMIGDVFYIANADNEASLECREVATGRQRWEVRRTSDGPHWASLVLADGRLYATGQKGVTRVFLPNPDQYEELAVNDLGEQTHATPAFSDGEIFIRTWRRLYCISERAAE